MYRMTTPLNHGMRVDERTNHHHTPSIATSNRSSEAAGPTQAGRFCTRIARCTPCHQLAARGTANTRPLECSHQLTQLNTSNELSNRFNAKIPFLFNRKGIKRQFLSNSIQTITLLRNVISVIGFARFELKQSNLMMEASH